MTRAVVLSCALVAGACQPVRMTSAEPYPVLVGPVKRIGGAAEPALEPGAKFEGQSEMFVNVCLWLAYPSFVVTMPSMDGGSGAALRRAYASYAGKRRLTEVTARVSAVDVGGWSSLFASCYSHHWWAAPEGMVAP
jgi:hypothetical protein